jgi:DNA topoisomerase-2
MTNQSRFIQMIIDGKLIVSRKKKAVLVAELKKLGFTPYSKSSDAKNAGELEQAAEDDEEDTDTVAGANDYDYLLGVSLHPQYVLRLLTTSRWQSGP